MSNALDYVLDDSFRLADFYVDAAKAIVTAPSGGGSGLLATAASASGNSASLGRQVSLQQHQEQYRHNTGWVYSCVRTIAQSAAGQPIRVARLSSAPSAKPIPGAKPPKKPAKPKRDADWVSLHTKMPNWLKEVHQHHDLDVLEDHPLLDTINNPNSLMVRWILIAVTFASLELTGKSYWWITDDPERPNQKGIFPLPSHWVEPKHTKSKLYNEWLVKPEGSVEPITVPGDQIVYLYYPDPSNPLSAISTLQAMARAVVADEAISETQRRMFANGIWPGFAITVGRHPEAAPGIPGQRPFLTKEQRGQLMAAVKQAYRGVVHADEPIILDGLIENVTKVSNNPREMDFLRSGQYTKEEITQGFGVNPIIMGQIEGANRAQSASAQDHFLQFCLNPKLELISQLMTERLGPKFAQANERLVIYIEKAKAVDADADLAMWTFLTTIPKTVTRNQILSSFNLPNVDGGDDLIDMTPEPPPAPIIHQLPAPGLPALPKPDATDDTGDDKPPKNPKPGAKPPAKPAKPVKPGAKPAKPPKGVQVQDLEKFRLDALQRWGVVATGPSGELSSVP